MIQGSFFFFALSGDSSSESDCESDGEGSSCSSSSDSDVFDVIAEIKRKKAHPDRLHEELWYNDPGQVGGGFFIPKMNTMTTNATGNIDAVRL